MELRDYLEMLNRRRLTILAVTLLVTVAAVAAHSLSDRYTPSRAVVTIPAVRADGVIAPMAADVNLERELEIARSEQVFERASETTGESARDLRQALSIAQATATSRGTIAFTAAHSDPHRAAELANSVANAYVSVTTAMLIADLEHYQEAVRAGSDEATDEAFAFIERLQESPLDVTELTVGRGATALDVRLADLSALMGLETSHAQLVSPAEAGVPEGGLGRNTVLGLTLGLFLGIAGAFVQEQVDDRVRRSGSVRATFPGIPVFDASDGGTREPFDTLRLLGSTIVGNGSGRGSHVVAVTAPTSAEDSSVVATALSVALAEQGTPVIGVAWSSEPGLAEHLDANEGPGLSGVVEGNVELSAALRDTSVPGIRVLPTGKTAADTTVLRARPAARDAIARVQSQAGGVIVVDAAPVLEHADIGYLSGVLSGVVLTVSAGRTRSEALTDSARLIEQMGVPLRAIVFHDAGSDTLLKTASVEPSMAGTTGAPLR